MVNSDISARAIFCAKRNASNLFKEEGAIPPVLHRVSHHG